MKVTAFSIDRMFARTLAASLLVLLCLSCAASAEQIKILAMGASNTAGFGVGAAQAWPAQLEAMLRARGLDAVVTVSAVNGETSASTLSRAGSAIQPGIKVVVYELSQDNDKKAGVSASSQQANHAAMKQLIRSRGATPIRAHLRPAGGTLGGPGYQADGHHLTAASHGKVAAMLVPQVLAAAKK